MQRALSTHISCPLGDILIFMIRHNEIECCCISLQECLDALDTSKDQTMGPMSIYQFTPNFEPIYRQRFSRKEKREEKVMLKSALWPPTLPRPC